MDPRERRLAMNETVFREINEQIEQQAAAQGPDQHVFEFLCECSNVDCTLRLELRLDEYEQVRTNPRRFIVGVGHNLPEIEKVVARNDLYWVVEKPNAAGELAEELDPRS